MGVLLGTVVGDHYRVVAGVGAGSMGVVYEVEDLRTNTAAAMKVLRPTLATDPVIAARFVREAKAMSMLDHRNIVDMLDLGRLEDGTLFLVTDLIRGVSLRDLLDAGLLEPSRALAIMRQVLEALDHAHARGVVHRDIKPENIMLVDGGNPADDTDLVKVLDFGIAKLLGDTLAVLGESSLTQTGCSVIGSPLYMAPEPVLGRPIDARTDLYSAGVVMFELLAGTPPFVADDLLVLMRMHVSAPLPTLAATAPDRSFTPALEYLIADSLAKRPEHRFASATHMLAALDEAARSIAERGTVAAPTEAASTKHQTIHSLAPPPALALPRAAFADTPAAQVAQVAPAGRVTPVTPVAPVGPVGRVTPAASPPALAASQRRPRDPQLRSMLLIGAGVVAAVIVVALVGSMLGGTDPAAETAGPASAGSAAASGPTRDGRDYLLQGHAELKTGQRVAALGSYERALQLTPELASDALLRTSVVSVLDTRDPVAAVIALEILATRLVPQGRDAIVAQASRGKAEQVRRRAVAIAERDGFAAGIDRVESWSLDVKQAASCDDRRHAIEKLRDHGDPRAIAVLKRVARQHACTEDAALAAIARLEDR